MRITQSMLSNNTLRHITNSYSKLGQLNEQMTTGKKFSKPSDNPVAAMKAMGYRTDLNRIEQFQQNISEVQNWTDSTDDALDQVGLALKKIRELTVQASNGTLEGDQRSYIAAEIDQLKEQIASIGDTQIGGKYIFGGTKTNVRPSDDFSQAKGQIEVEVFSGIKLPLNFEGADLFMRLVGNETTDGEIDKLTAALKANASEEEISGFLSTLDEQIDNLLSARATIGARQNRVKLMDDRLSNQEVFSTRILSDNEDVDLERVIIDLISQESVHRSAMSVGARLIQPTLMDFLR